MITARVVKTFVYPVKGMAGIQTTERGLHINPTVGVVGDRNFAVAKNPMPETTWQKKAHFRVCMNTPECAKQKILHDHMNEHDLDENFRPPRSLIEEVVMSSDPFTAGHLIDTGGEFNMGDSSKPYVSLLNLDSVRALARYIGKDIDPHRFRMNGWIDGLGPFKELKWCTEFERPDQFPLTIGDVSFGIDDICERCKAINANPSTGQYDDDILRNVRDLLSRKGYASPQRSVSSVMGVLAIPTSSGIIRSGQEITLG